MFPALTRLRHRGCTALVAITIALCLNSVPIDQAGASYESHGMQGNCNNQHPHNWAWTQWSGYSSSDSGGVEGSLWRWDPSVLDWYLSKDSSSYEPNASAATVWSNNYRSDTYYKTSFQGRAKHWGSVEGNRTVLDPNKGIWCP